MADDKPKTVKVTALQPHSYNGKEYEPGDSYDIDENLVTSVTVQGKAAASDPAAVAKAAAKPAKAAKADRKPRAKKGKR